MSRLLALCGILLLASVALAHAQVVVDIDVKPGSEAAPINVKSHGSTPVAILCSTTFDPATVETSTVTIGTASAQHCALEDVNADACVDLVRHFATQDLGVVCGATELTLTGSLTDGTTFSGTDTIKVVPCKP